MIWGLGLKTVAYELLSEAIAGGAKKSHSVHKANLGFLRSTKHVMTSSLPYAYLSSRVSNPFVFPFRIQVSLLFSFPFPSFSILKVRMYW